MRIISGKYKGRRIEPPKNITARPTTDFAKESLFNLLQNRMDFVDAEVLDLFSGTGCISFECVSRGANEVIAVELAHVQQNFIIQTSKQLGINNLHVIRGDAFKYLKTDQSGNARFDLVFADPPYSHPELPILPTLVFEGQWLKPDGWFVLEHPKDYDFSSYKGFVEHRVYGSVNFSFFQAK